MGIFSTRHVASKKHDNHLYTFRARMLTNYNILVFHLILFSAINVVVATSSEVVSSTRRHCPFYRVTSEDEVVREQKPCSCRVRGGGEEGGREVPGDPRTTTTSKASKADVAHLNGTAGPYGWFAGMINLHDAGGYGTPLSDVIRRHGSHESGGLRLFSSFLAGAVRAIQNERWRIIRPELRKLIANSRWSERTVGKQKAASSDKTARSSPLYGTASGQTRASSRRNHEPLHLLSQPSVDHLRHALTVGYHDNVVSPILELLPTPLDGTSILKVNDLTIASAPQNHDAQKLVSFTPRHTGNVLSLTGPVELTRSAGDSPRSTSPTTTSTTSNEEESASEDEDELCASPAGQELRTMFSAMVFTHFQNLGVSEHEVTFPSFLRSGLLNFLLPRTQVYVEEEGSTNVLAVYDRELLQNMWRYANNYHGGARSANLTLFPDASPELLAEALLCNRDAAKREELAKLLMEIQELTRPMREEPRLTFLDLGANVGLWSLMAATQFKSEILAFEPVEGNVERLRETLYCDNKELLLQNFANRFVHLFPVAVGAPEEAGESRTMSLVHWSAAVLREGTTPDDTQEGAQQDQGGGSQGKNDLQLEEAFEISEAQKLGLVDAQGRPMASARLRLHTVDSIWRRHLQSALSPRREVFVKVDVEGFECAALLGAAEFLRSSRVWGVFFEYSPPWQEGSSIREGGEPTPIPTDYSCVSSHVRDRMTALFRDLKLYHFFAMGAGYVYPQFGCHLPSLWSCISAKQRIPPLKNGSAINIFGIRSELISNDEELTNIWRSVN
ncbi:unnamed protein product [Amoebophrya sp. A25]|nr:unnamed protein product [Amoebophrya sp. A25]|eukprot:GSA25T00004796001.1